MSYMSNIWLYPLQDWWRTGQISCPHLVVVNLIQEAHLTYIFMYFNLGLEAGVLLHYSYCPETCMHQHCQRGKNFPAFSLSIIKAWAALFMLYIPSACWIRMYPLQNQRSLSTVKCIIIINMWDINQQKLCRSLKCSLQTINMSNKVRNS